MDTWLFSRGIVLFSPFFFEEVLLRGTFPRRHVVDVFAFCGELGTGFLLYTIEFLRFNC